MAKGRSHSGSRDDYSIANPVFEPVLRPAWLSRPILDPIHDLRVYNPTTQLLGPLEVSPARPSRVFSASIAERTPRLDRSPSFRTDRFGNRLRTLAWQRPIRVFSSPKRVPICMRREQRREVLFARGKGGRGFRKPRWNQRSYVRCK